VHGVFDVLVTRASIVSMLSVVVMAFVCLLYVRAMGQALSRSPFRASPKEHGVFHLRLLGGSVSFLAAALYVVECFRVPMELRMQALLGLAMAAVGALVPLYFLRRVAVPVAWQPHWWRDIVIRRRPPIEEDLDVS
jgi:hypothetical protein